MEEFDDHNKQENRDSSWIDVTLFDLKVIEFSHDSFHWSEFIVKYHINFICSKGSAHFSSSDVFYQVGPSDYVAWSVYMEISEKCCFFNPSHFSRYFKKFLGISPKEYRLRIENRNTPKS